MKFPYNEEDIFCIKSELLNFKITLPLAKLDMDMVSSRLISNDLIFSNDILVNSQLVTYILCSNVGELNIGAKTKKKMITIATCKIHCTYKKNQIIFSIFLKLFQYISDFFFQSLYALFYLK